MLRRLPGKWRQSSQLGSAPFFGLRLSLAWGTKEGQEITLGLRIRRSFFDRLLANAVPSSFEASGLADRTAWAAAVEASEVRLQWDPDHAPDGAKLARRAVQMGLRGQALRELATSALVEVIDMTAWVAEQRAHALGDWQKLRTPVENVYPVSSHRPRAEVEIST